MFFTNPEKKPRPAGDQGNLPPAPYASGQTPPRLLINIEVPQNPPAATPAPPVTLELTAPSDSQPLLLPVRAPDSVPGINLEIREGAPASPPALPGLVSSEPAAEQKPPEPISLVAAPGGLPRINFAGFHAAPEELSVPAEQVSLEPAATRDLSQVVSAAQAPGRPPTIDSISPQAAPAEPGPGAPAQAFRDGWFPDLHAAKTTKLSAARLMFEQVKGQFAYPANEKLPGALQKDFSLWLYTVLIIVVTLGAGSRIFACTADFRFDEIWSLFRSKELGALSRVFTTFNEANSHYLNTLFFFLSGDQPGWTIYRIPSLAAGTLTVPLVWLVAGRIGALEAIIATLLTAGSYLMIDSSSIARGYSLAVFFGIAVYFTAERYSAGRRPAWALAAAACTILGLLSHPTFVHVFVAAVIWLAFQRKQENAEWRENVLDIPKYFGLPVAASAFFYISVMRRIPADTGPLSGIPDVLLQALSYAAGWAPASHLAAVFLGALLLGFAALGIIRLRRKGRSEWVFFGAVIFLAPAAMVVVAKPGTLIVHSFLLSIFFGHIASSYLLADIYRRSSSGRTFVTAVLLLFLLANAWQVANLARYGRGGYLKAMRHIAGSTPSGETLSIATDDPFRNGTLIEYYNRFLPQGKRIVMPGDLKSRLGPRWLILNYFNNPGSISWTYLDPYGQAFELNKIFPYAGPSGWGWLVYERDVPQ